MLTCVYDNFDTTQYTGKLGYRDVFSACVTLMIVSSRDEVLCVL